MKEEIFRGITNINKVDIIRKLLSIIVGNFLCASALILFLKPNMMISGGITGGSLLLSQVSGIPVGLLIFVINIPLIILGFIYLHRIFTIFSLISMTLFSFYLTVFEVFMPDLVITQDVVVACIFGGVLNGIGMGIMFRNGTSQGGLDIVAAICKKKFSVNIGSVSMAVNVVIITISSFVYSVDRALYTMVSLYIAYYFLDKIQTGVGVQKQIFIISDRDEEIAREIQNTIHRGVTYLEGKGAYTMTPHKVIYTITNNIQMVKVKDIVNKIDPDAFLAVSNTSEISGKGFRKMEF